MPGSARPYGHPEVFATLFALSFLAARALPVLELGLGCPFRTATGLPCATCGMTRAFVHLAHGEWTRALAASPLGAVLAGGIWAFALLDLLRLALGRPWPRLPEGAARVAALAGVAALLLNWAWLLAIH